MAATITWSQEGYYAATTGKKLVSKIKWKCTGVDGSASSFEEGIMDIEIMRTSEDLIDDVSIFATDSNLIAVAKSRLGDDQVSEIEARVTAGLSQQWYTT
tara:strand:- start:577 stop:876 length:300 start_codon:yes stop_codon:yes gene_type:complete